MKFSKKCSELFKREKSLGYHTMSCDGIFELLNWIRKISSSTMNEIEFLEKKGEVSVEEMVWAFNRVRINYFSNSSLATTFDAQDSNHTYDKQVAGKKSKRDAKNEHAGAEKAISDLTWISNSPKKSENGSDLKTLPYLPWEVLLSHVLPKLPFDSLLRFKCVCKKWKETISSTQFQCLLRELEDSLIQSYGFIVSNSYKKSSKEVKVKKFDGLELVEIDITSTMNVYQAFFYASCSSVLSLTCASDDHYLLAVANPLTGEWTTISPPYLTDKDEFDADIKGPGLAVNLSNYPQWYKLVVPVFRREYGMKKVLFYVFSSEAGEWKASNAVLPKIDVQRLGNSVYANGLLYWVSSAKKLCWFNLDRDVVGFIDLPYPDFNVSALGTWEQPGEEHRPTLSLFVDLQRVETYTLLGEHWEMFFSVPMGERFGVKPFSYLGGHCQLVWERKNIVAYDIRSGKRWIVASGRIESKAVTLFAFKLSICSLPRILKKEEETLS